MPIKLHEIMVKDIISVEEKVTARQAVELMNKHEIGCLIVVKKGKPSGILTERDMLTRVLVESKDPNKTEVREIMSSPIIVGNPQMDIEEAIRLMFKRNIKKLPVVDSNNLVGLVTLTDLIRSKKIVKILQKLQSEEIPKRMAKVIDPLNRIILVPQSV